MIYSLSGKSENFGNYCVSERISVQLEFIMTATAVPTSSTTQALTEWTKVFPRQATETYTSSVTFMKQLTVVGVSTVTYLKNAFPEENYKVETFGGIKIRILKKKCNDELAQFLSNAMAQAFEAFEKKYLHRLAVCFYDGDCSLDNLVEYHIFEYSYKPDGMTMSINSKGRDTVEKSVTFTLDNVREKTMQLIRACVVVMEMNKQAMADNCDVSVRLYYNEDAPEGYQAPGFVAGADTEDPLGHTYEDSLKLGRVETNHHKLVLRSYIRETSASNEPIPSENPPVITQAPGEFQSSAREHRSVSESSSVVRCVCNNFETDEPVEMLICMYCGSQQHATCYGVPGARAAEMRHCCVACSDQDNTRVPTDARLASVAANKRQCFAIFRRSLELCARNVHVSTSVLCDKLGLSQLSAVKLMKLLRNSGIIEQHSQAGLTTSSKIDHNQLQIVINQYFQTGEENVAACLLAESFAMPSSQSNPVEDILSPLKKVSLENASQIGRVVETSEVEMEPPNSQNPTLQHYREAMVLVERDDNIGQTAALNDIEKLKRAGKRKETDKELSTGVRTKRARVAKK